MILFAGEIISQFYLALITRTGKVFVQNSVTEIRKLTSTWKCVSSEDNQADYPTPGMTFAELRDCKKWCFGPVWLSQEKEKWPGQPQSLRESDPE